MKKIISCTLIICLVLLMAGCGKTKPTESTGTQTEPTAPADAADPVTNDSPYAAVSLPIISAEVFAGDGTLIFSKSYQDMSLTLTGQVTADAIILDFMNKVDAAVSSADSIADTAKQAYTGSENWIPYSFKMRYAPMRIDSGILSLYGSTVTFNGGSHPEYACVAANYSLISGDPLTLGSILTHEDKIDDLRDLVIGKLDAQAQEKYLQEGYGKVIENRFLGEVSYDDDWYFSETGLCFYFAPYEIAPYSSGVIVAEIPYSELVGIIADEFFPAENSIRNGSASVVPFSDETAQGYEQISELILDNDGQMYFVEADSCIMNIQIHLKTEDPNMASSDIVYMAHYLNPGDAIMVQVLPEHAANLTVSYVQEGAPVSIPFISE